MSRLIAPAVAAFVWSSLLLMTPTASSAHPSSEPSASPSSVSGSGWPNADCPSLLKLGAPAPYWLAGKPSASSSSTDTLLTLINYQLALLLCVSERSAASPSAAAPSKPSALSAAPALSPKDLEALAAAVAKALRAQASGPTEPSSSGPALESPSGKLPPLD